MHTVYQTQKKMSVCYWVTLCHTTCNILLHTYMHAYIHTYIYKIIKHTFEKTRHHVSGGRIALGPVVFWQCWFSAGQKGISAARRGETGEKVFLP